MAWLKKRTKSKAKKTSVAPEHAENRGMQEGPVKDTVAFLHPHTLRTYAVLLQYYEERMDTPGIDASDTQLAKLQELLFVKRKLPVRFQDLQCRLAARLIPARMAYATHNSVPLARVTLEDLEESPEGVQHWLEQADPSRDTFEGGQPFEVEMDPKESAMRISEILNEREEWLCESGLDTATVMDIVQREEFLGWAVNRFLLQPGKSVPDESYRESLCRFFREQERRVGSTEIWEALSHTRLLKPQDVRNAFKGHGTPTDSPPRPLPKNRFCPKPRPKPRPSPRGMQTGSQSAADGAGEPVAGKRPLPATVLENKETQLWLGHQNKRSRNDIRAKTYQEARAMRREDYACNLWRRAEHSVTSREDQEDPVAWLESLCDSQPPNLMAILGRTA